MQAIQYIGPGKITSNEVPEPRAAEGEVIIEVAYAGICGTDMTIWSGMHPRARGPLTLGHEVSGRVAALGPGGAAGGIRPGDKVTFNPLISCGVCRACREGHRHACYQLRLYGIDRPGGMAQFVAVPAGSVLRLPEGVDMAKASLVEPLAVGIHAAAQGAPLETDRVLVVGSGPIGLVTALALRRAGVRELLISDVSDFRLALARRLGFAVIDVRREKLADRVAAWTDGAGADQVYEVSGHESAIPGLLEVVRVRGRLIIVSVHKEPRLIDLRLVNFKEIEIRGSRCYTDAEFAGAIRSLDDVPAEALITHRLPLAEGEAGFRAMLDPEVSCKVLFAAG